MQNLFSNHIALWAVFIAILHLMVVALTAIHILLRKDDERAAIGWIGLVFFSPFLGGVIYWMFGINRIKHNAKPSTSNTKTTERLSEEKSYSKLTLDCKWESLMRSGYAIHNESYLAHNQIEPLINGDMAYPQMLDAIHQAKRDIVLSSYIFDYDKTGRKFVDALGQARERSVSVYVLIEGDFLDYRWRRIERELRKRDVKTTKFLPFRPRFINLRNHRKILSIDGQIAFIGGLNISQDNMLEEYPGSPVQDVHFKAKGPVIDQISRAFNDDWFFATGELLELSLWNSSLNPECERQVTCRVLLDGPDENFQKLAWTLLAAINSAEKNIRIMTPYFIPDHIIMCALQAASLRGVNVKILVPEKNNIPFFSWAMQANFDALLEFGLKIHLSASPFEHSKLFLVDDCWSFIGSANWDARSLALNFEINLECFDCGLNDKLTKIFNEKMEHSKTVKSNTASHYSIGIKVRNNFFRLLSAYL